MENDVEKAIKEFLEKGGEITKCPPYRRTASEDIKYKGYRKKWNKKKKDDGNST